MRYECPRCRNTALRVTATVSVYIGTATKQDQQLVPNFDYTSPTQCLSCGYDGELCDFQSPRIDTHA